MKIKNDLMDNDVLLMVLNHILQDCGLMNNNSM